MDKLDEKYEALIIELSDRLKKEGVSKSSSIDGIEFETFSPEEQVAIINRTEEHLAQHDIITPEKDAPSKLLEFCEYHGLVPVDKSVYQLLTNDHFWEVIDFNLNQLYRNSKIYQLSGYSLAEMVAYSPWQLYNRPEHVLSSLMEFTEVLKQSDKLIDMRGMPPYIMEEVLSKKQAKYQVAHQFCCMLKSIKTGQPKAFLSAFHAFELDPETQRKISVFQ